MRLEIRNLAPYLSYGLQFISEMDVPFDEHYENPVWTLNGVSEMFGDYCLLTKENSDAYVIDSCKPILRPLSDLDKLDGDFATSHSICKMLGNGEDYGNVTIYHFNGEVTIETETDSGTVGYVSLDFSTTQLIREELLKSHYDIFGLVEAGLAIDINSLDN